MIFEGSGSDARVDRSRSRERERSKQYEQERGVEVNLQRQRSVSHPRDHVVQLPVNTPPRELLLGVHARAGKNDRPDRETEVGLREKVLGRLVRGQH